MGALRVLILEDHQEDAELLVLALHRDGIECDWTRVETRAAYLDALRSQPDIVLSDYSLPGFTAIEALDVLRETGLEIPVIVVTGAMNEETCVGSLRHGAIDYLLKDRLTRLGSAVRHALEEKAVQRSRREAEDASQRLAAMLKGVIDNSPSAIYVKDAAGRYVVANRRLEELLGVEAGATRGQRDADILPTPVAEALASLDPADQHDRTEAREVEFGSDDGRRVYLSSRYPIPIDGQPEAVGGIYTDITRIKRIESDLRGARTELRRQAASLAQDNLDLRELDRIKGEFIESVSHELRTPLSIINGTVEMMLGGDFGDLSEQELDMVSNVERAGHRLYATISDLLTVFEMDRGGFALNIRPVQLADVIKKAVGTLTLMLQRAEITAHVDIAPDLPPVAADGDQIGRVLLNLLTNAIKFSPPGSAVGVTARRQRDQVVVRVRDTGAGIPPSEQAEAFLRFRRGRGALRQATQGAGLGLAISKEIVERHQGWIDLESAENQGTTVTFGLPVAPEQDVVSVPGHHR